MGGYFTPLPGTVISNLVLSLDLAASLIDVCGAQPLKSIPGLSWKPLLEGKRARWRDAFLYEYNYEKQFPYTPNVRAIRTANWKFIRYPHGDAGPDRFTAELYDLRSDPLEMTNLISRSRCSVGILTGSSRTAQPRTTAAFSAAMDFLPVAGL